MISRLSPILLTLFPLLLQAQSHADTLRDQGDLKGALLEFHRIYVNEPQNTFNLYNYACALSVSNNADSAFKYLYILVEKDLQNLSHALTDPDFLNIRSSKSWPAFEDSLVNSLITKGFLTISDLQLAHELWKMKAFDQAYYSDIDLLTKKFGPRSKEVSVYWSLKDSINKVNVKRLEEIIAAKGWPRESAVGWRAASAAFLIIQHSDLEKQKKYLPVIENLCKQKEASWQSYAMMYDRIQVSENKPQKYGTQIRYNELTKTPDLYPLENKSMVEEWRKQVGLQPLADYVKFWGLTLDSDYRIVKNYIPYHQTCRRAEQLFIDSCFKQCVNTYDSLFKTYDFLFPRDCFTAAQLAYKAGYDSLAVEFLKKGVPYGLNSDMIFKSETSIIIRNIRQSCYWKSYTASYDSLRSLYLKRVDWNLKKILYRMVAIDQKMRARNNKWFNRTFRKGLEKGFNRMNRMQMAFLDSVFSKQGYPGIWLTGVGDSTDVAFNNNINLSEIFSIILHHNDSSILKYGNRLYSEIENGHLHPRVYALIRDFSDRFSVSREKNQKMYYNIWWESKNYSPAEYEAHCNEIGCPTKNHLRRLIKAAGPGIELWWYPFR